MQFTKAVRKKAKLRLALTGPSGSGKTLGALMIAKGLGGKTAVLDTEHGSASLYTEPMTLPNGDVFEPPAFDVLELEAPYSPERYTAAIKAAEEAGYDNLIIDSTTHEWSGSGGCLEINEKLAAAKFRGNTWSAWNETTPRHRAFIDAMLQANMHVIATGRSKTETAQTEDGGGRKKVVKLGMKTEQRDGFEYEFTVVLDIIHAGHHAVATKDRTGLFVNGDAEPISPQTGAKLLAWLNSGAVPAPAPQPAPPPAATDTGSMSPASVQSHTRALTACATKKDLDVAWKAAKAACQLAGDTAAYEVLKDAMSKAADAIKANEVPA